MKSKIMKEVFRLELFKDIYIDEMINLFKESIENSCFKDYSSEQIEAWISRAHKTRWRKIFNDNYSIVVFADKMMIGFGDITKDNYLNMLYVHHEYQNRGVASLICDELEKRAKGTITVDASLTAKSFFLKRGYKVVKEQTINIDGVMLNNFKMMKNID